MNQSPLYIAILAALSTSTLSSTTYAETDKLKKITVAATAEEAAPQEDTHTSAELLDNGNSETGDVLRQVNGVSAARKGGHGLDPQIRGQQYSQLNILLDGAKIEGGCPNRMDPPTSYSEVSSYDEVVVIRGVNSVLNGPGGSGGTILFNRQKPTYNPEKNHLRRSLCWEIEYFKL
ncbi:TonB-dependent receptor [Hydrogenovibrio crunogenus]|uniref:TonB-dependent receptor n=1 Tax=Hydrogenovibrio crunogenus TaxID=39765 RepID=A0A4P7P0J0_9GAMM|nr:TonB-dependent receptor plug domain-containing protein [Hydrogenovibrio crunogenus]QBZ83603.1 TonB-dependent receptor [Hydrogenovibrio crunogenus]